MHISNIAHSGFFLVGKIVTQPRNRSMKKNHLNILSRTYLARSTATKSDIKLKSKKKICISTLHLPWRRCSALHENETPVCRW